MNLRQDVLRPRTPDSLNKRLVSFRLNVSHLVEHDSDDELVNVTSIPGTPTRTSSRPQSRAPSPRRTRPLLGNKRLASDPLRALPTELSQRIFSYLSVPQLARCALVSKKWNKSQTINYVWFQRYRQENFQDDSLPPGKWTKRESKQNWRVMFLQPKSRTFPHTLLTDAIESGTTSPTSGDQTPKELREEKWRLETERPGKLEMREFYKELGGRKPRTKAKVGSTGIRDKGGWASDGD